MNTANIQATIDILKRAQNFNIGVFQYGTFQASRTEEELHACGNSACIAGYVAVSPEWHAVGGSVSLGGAPEMLSRPRANPCDLMSEFWGLNWGDADAIVYGESWRGFIARHKLTDMPRLWDEMTKEQAISLFEQLLAST